MHSRLTVASTPGAVFEIIGPAFSELHALHLTTALHRIAKLTSGQSSAERKAFFQSHDEQMRELLTAIHAALPTFEARQLAACAYASSLIWHGPSRPLLEQIRSLLHEIGPFAAPRVGEMHSQALANLMWAHAVADVHAPAVFEAVSTMARSRLGGFSLQGLSALAWSYAKLRLHEPELLSKVASEVVSRHALGQTAERMGPRELTILAWSFGSLHSVDGRTALLDSLAHEALQHLGAFNSRDLAQLVWTYAKSTHPAPRLFEEVARVAPARLDKFNSQDFSNIVWAYATASVEAEPLFRAVAVAAQPRLREFTPQGLANLAWAFAKTGSPSALPLLEATATIFTPRLPELRSRHIAMIVWAFAKAGIHAEEPYRAVERELAGRSLSTFNHVELVNVAWAFATARIHAPVLLERIAAEVGTRVSEFEPQMLANVAWSFARLRTPSDRTFAAIAEEVGRRALHSFNPQNYANLVWAFATAGVDASRLIAIVSPAVIARRAEFKSIELANLAWALAVTGLLEREVMAGLLERLELLRDVPEHEMGGAEVLCQVHVANMALLLQAPELGLSLSPHMGRRCFAAMRSLATGHASMSGRHLRVSQALLRLGHAHENEITLPLLGYRVDVALSGRHVLIEASGALSYDSKRQLLPSIAMKMEHMRLVGWQVLEIPFWEWPAEAHDQDAYLSAKLATLSNVSAAVPDPEDGSRETRGAEEAQARIHMSRL